MNGNSARSLLRGLADFCLRGNPLAVHRRPRLRDAAAAYRESPSFSELLPWLDILEDDSVLLEDGCSLGAVLELRAVDVEGKSAHFCRALQKSLQQLLGDSFPEHERAPWVLQIFCFLDENGLREDAKSLVHHAPSSGAGPWRDEFLRILGEHVEDISHPRGLFCDPLNEEPWRGSRRRVLACLYRRQLRDAAAEPGQAQHELARQVRRFSTQLETAGIASRRCRAEEIRNWLRCWFHTAPAAAEEQAQHDVPRSFDYSLADALCPSRVRSEAGPGVWHFGERVHRVRVLQRLRGVPQPGQLSAERMAGKRTQCLLEQLPPGAVLTLTLAFTPQDFVLTHLERIEHGAVGDGEAAEAGRSSAQDCRRRIVRGDRVYPFSLAVFLRAQNTEQLAEQSTRLDALFLANRLQLVPADVDPVALDAWLRYLPMGYRPALDQLRRRNRFIYVSDAAALLPVYGRATGSRRPGLVFFNRGGELFACDPLSMEDRTKNAHLFVFGPTGAGKSALLVYLQMVLMAFQRPRLIAVEAGNSFALLARFLHSRGFRTLDLSLGAGCGVSLPPFAAALQLGADTGADTGAVAGRDVLGELTLIARLMVTGGHAQEEAVFSRSDQAALQQALLQAARQVRARNGDTVRVSDVCAALRERGTERQRHGGDGGRLAEMAEAMSLFTTGLAGELFDRPGQPLSDADYLRFEMGVLGAGQHPEQLAVAWLGLVNAVVALAQRTQHDGRPIILLTDEAHVITGNPLLASYLVKISKLLGRRLGLWLWMATQNMKDFQGEAEKMLAMFEWWLCLCVGEGELRELERFRHLEEDERGMLLGARKAPGKYTEGVLLADTVRARFRNVPPALCLALAQTEKEEKSERARLMARHDCSELEAVFMIAREIASRRRDARQADGR